MWNDREWQLPTEYEKDVWFYCNKFGLNRSAFRMIMRFPIVYNKVHKLDYEKVSASDLLAALQDGYRHAMSEANKIPDMIPRRAMHQCRNRLIKIIESESNQV